MKLTKRQIKLREARGLIWHNITEFPVTFGNCATPGCDGHGRGSGRCLDCAEKDLAKAIGPGGVKLASDYVTAVREARQGVTKDNRTLAKIAVSLLEKAMVGRRGITQTKTET